MELKPYLDEEIVCSICLEGLDPTTIMFTKCNHVFHRKCLSFWYEENDHCPYCRTKLDINYIFQYDKFYSMYYNFSNIKRKTININGLDTCFIEKCLKNNNKLPSAWLKTPNIYPLYNFYWDSNTHLITLYLRLYLLYSGVDKTTMLRKNDLMGTEYFDTNNNIFKYFDKNSFQIYYEWIYELLTILRYEYNFTYITVYNTLICDLMLLTIKGLNIENKHLFQTIIIVSVYSCVNFLNNIKIDIDRLIWYTATSSKKSDFNQFLKFQEDYIKNNIIKILV